MCPKDYNIGILRQILKFSALTETQTRDNKSILLKGWAEDSMVTRCTSMRPEFQPPAAMAKVEGGHLPSQCWEVRGKRIPGFAGQPVQLNQRAPMVMREISKSKTKST